MVSFLSGSKKAVFELLQAEPELSLKQVHLKLNKQGIQITNQGTFKLLKEMTKQDALTKKGKNYSLNPGWIKKSKEYFESIEKDLKNEVPSLEKLKEMNYFSHTFTSGPELGEFIIDKIFHLPTKNHPIFCLFYHIYTLIGVDESLICSVQELTKNEEFIAVIHSDSKWEGFFKPMYEKLNWKVFTGKPVANECDWVIVGDYVLRVFFPEEHKKDWVKLVEAFEKNKINLTEVFKQSIEVRRDFLVILEKNQLIAEQMRKNAFKLIDK